MSTKALDINRGDKVWVRFPIPGATDKKNIIKEARVVSTVKRGAKVQVNGDNLCRHMTWNNIALDPKDFESRPEPEDEPEVVEETEEAPAPSAMDNEVSTFDRDLDEWMSMGDDLVGGFIRKRDVLNQERKEVQQMISDMEARRAEIDQEIQVLGTRINKANELLKAIRSNGDA